jgi:hypothetical protein
MTPLPVELSASVALALNRLLLMVAATHRGRILGCGIGVVQDMVQWRTLVDTVINTSGFISDRKYLKQLSDCQLLKKGFGGG